MPTTKQRAITLLALIFIIIVPIKKNFWIQNLFVWDHFTRYFQTKIVGTPFSRKQTVFGIIPHGIVPLTLGKFISKVYFFLLLALFLFSNSFLLIFIFLFAFFSRSILFVLIVSLDLQITLLFFFFILLFLFYIHTLFFFSI